MAAAPWSFLGPRPAVAGPHDEIQLRAPTHTSSQRYLGSLPQDALDESPQGTHSVRNSTEDLHGAGLPRRRRLAQEETCEQVHAAGRWGSIRIGYELVDVGEVPRALVEFVDGTLMRRAVSFWSSALQVRWASSPLRAERKGSGCKKYPFDDQWHCTSSTPPECGVDGMRIPERYLKAKRTCSSRCSPAYSCSGACWPNQQSCICNIDDWEAQRSNYCCQVGRPLPADCPQSCSSDSAHFMGSGLGGGLVCEDGCTQAPEGPGAQNEDLHLFVTIKDTPSCRASTETGAYASWCVKDQCDRPIFGTVNFCLSRLSVQDKDIPLQVSTAVHELAHTMVFSSSLFKYFRNVDGTPMMPRSPSDPDTFRNEVWWSCGNGGFTYPDASGSQRHVDLSPNIVNKFNERGFSDCRCPIGTGVMTSGCFVAFSGVKVPTCAMRVVTPNVLEAAREHFNCRTLPGAELENQDSSQCSIIASHWEQRVFNGEVMTAKYGTTGLTYLSRVTLALFQDSGWYQADMSMADTLVQGVHWGYQQGCAFAQKKCIVDGAPVWDRAFCTVQGDKACSLDRTHVRKCALNNMPSLPPSVFDYFGTALLGTFDELDYCPTYSIRLTNRVCTSGASIFSPYSNVNMMREVFNSGSRCMESTLRADVVNKDGIYVADASEYTSKRPTCYEVDCATDGSSYSVKVADVSGGAGATMALGTCKRSGQVLTSSQFQGGVTCASPSEMCQVVPSLHNALAAPVSQRAAPPAPSPSGHGGGGGGAAGQQLGTKEQAVPPAGRTSSQGGAVQQARTAAPPPGASYADGAVRRRPLSRLFALASVLLCPWLLSPALASGAA